MRKVSFFLLAAVLLLTAAGCGNQEEIVTTASGLQYVILEKGQGDSPRAGDTVTVHYVGKLTDGAVFDSSLERGVPFEFQIGAGQVIRGWDQGISMMRRGGKRQLIIPPELGYGVQGNGEVIPPNATLIFEVELLSIRPQE